MILEITRAALTHAISLSWLKTEGSQVPHRQNMLNTSLCDVLYILLWWVWFHIMGLPGITEYDSDFELHGTKQSSWAINLHYQLPEERERDAEPPGMLRKIFPSSCTSKELSFSRSTSGLRPSQSDMNKVRLFWLSRICLDSAAPAGRLQHTRYRPRFYSCSAYPWCSMHGCCGSAV